VDPASGSTDPIDGSWIRSKGARGHMDPAGGSWRMRGSSRWPSQHHFYTVAVDLFFCFFHPQSETRPKVCLSPFSCNWRHAPARLGLAYILRCDFGNAFVPRLYLDFGNVSSACFSSSAYLMT
jgi:hypothetical protein